MKADKSNALIYYFAYMDVGKGREHICRTQGTRVTHDCMAEDRTMPGAIVENDSGDKVEQQLPRKQKRSFELVIIVV